MYYYNIDQGDVIIRNGKKLIILGYNWVNMELRLIPKYRNDAYCMFSVFLNGITIEDEVQTYLGKDLYFLER